MRRWRDGAHASSDDFNAWDCLHVVNRHPTLTPAEVLSRVPRRPPHLLSLAARGLVAGDLATACAGWRAGARYGMLTQQLYFTYAYRRGWHPMMGGLWRTPRPLGAAPGGDRRRGRGGVGRPEAPVALPVAIHA